MIARPVIGGDTRTSRQGSRLMLPNDTLVRLERRKRLGGTSSKPCQLSDYRKFHQQPSELYLLE
jgi:hypothetical protein